jgi:hypothetical protein
MRLPSGEITPVASTRLRYPSGAEPMTSPLTGSTPTNDPSHSRRNTDPSRDGPRGQRTLPSVGPARLVHRHGLEDSLGESPTFAPDGSPFALVQAEWIRLWDGHTGKYAAASTVSTSPRALRLAACVFWRRACRPVGRGRLLRVMDTYELLQRGSGRMHAAGQAAGGGMNSDTWVVTRLWMMPEAVARRPPRRKFRWTCRRVPQS